MTTILAWFIGSNFAGRVLRATILLPIIFVVTNFILTTVTNLVSGIIIPESIPPYLRYFWIDKCFSMFFSFLQMKWYLKLLNLYLKAV